MSAESVHGWCEREVQRELPGLGLMFTVLDSLPDRSLTGGSPVAVRARLAELSNRWRGARAVNVRQERIPAAYRVFFRHIGLDPDVTRTPIEAAVLGRMLDGGFLSDGLLLDALTVALVDTGVPVWALDADTVEGPLGIRLGREGDRIEPALGVVQANGQLLIADSEGPVATLFGDIARANEPTSATRRLALFAVQVAGVPELHVQEALWVCQSTIWSGEPQSGRTEK
jgi:DNA/RNA-binding domain of Phe-tRNA-synthetase-like protein